MASEIHTDQDTMTEYCEACGCETRHSVSITLIQESTKNSNTEFSREPYRISRCNSCGSTEQVRMNNQ